MADDDKRDEKKPDYEPPRGAASTGTWNETPYTASANWIVLRKKEKPAAELFSVSYVAHQGGDRPVTFVFNGGPGASSAYLHMGAVGPLRVAFPADGTLPQMPPRLVPNEESWLAFTDLVFVDPVGTGFSRVVEEGRRTAKDGRRRRRARRRRPKEYFGYKRDLESLCEFIGRWLSANGRWGSPVFIAGESYGGYRVGRLVRMLQEEAGDRTQRRHPHLPRARVRRRSAAATTTCSRGSTCCRRWRPPLCTMGGRARSTRGARSSTFLPEAEAFATGDYAAFLTRGASMPADERERILARLAD